MLKRIICFLFVSCFFIVKTAYAQTDKIDSLLNEVMFQDDDFMEIYSSANNFQFLYARMNYDNKTFFAGRDIGIDQYNMTGQVSYFNSIGISLGAAAAYYSEMDPRISTFLIMAGYNGQFEKFKSLRYRASYTHYFFPKSSVLASSSFNGCLNGGLSFDQKILGTRVDYSLLMGKEYGSQVSWDVYGRINLLKFGKFNKIKFEPEISLYFGSDKTIITQVSFVPGRLPRQYITTDLEKSKFGWMNTEIKMPITISYRSFDFELGYNLNLPRSIVTSEKLTSTSYFNLSFGYAISL